MKADCTIAAAVIILLLPQVVTGSADTLTAEIEEGEFIESSDEYAVAFGAGCSLACGIDWVFEASSELAPRLGIHL